MIMVRCPFRWYLDRSIPRHVGLVREYEGPFTPHPALSPRERENRSPAFGVLKRGACGTLMELDEAVGGCSLSQWERVRVRGTGGRNSATLRCRSGLRCKEIFVS